MVNFNMQFHGDLVSLIEDSTEGFETVRNTKTEVGHDAWRRLNHKYDPRNPLRNIQLLEKFACAWLFRSDCKYGEARARVESCLPESWQQCSRTLEIDSHGVHPEDLPEDPS